MLRLNMVSIQSGALIALAAVLSSCSDEGATGTVKSIPEIAAVEANASDWPTYGGQSSGTKYAALDQINTENVDQLKLAWTYHTGDLETDGAVADWTVSEMTPIYANDRLYICTPYSRVEALDPATGKKLWVHDPKKPLTGNMYKQNYCRGVAYWQSDDAATGIAVSESFLRRKMRYFFPSMPIAERHALISAEMVVSTSAPLIIKAQVKWRTHRRLQFTRMS